jgi:hypothetical protein
MKINAVKPVSILSIVIVLLLGVSTIGRAQVFATNTTELQSEDGTHKYLVQTDPDETLGASPPQISRNLTTYNDLEAQGALGTPLTFWDVYLNPSSTQVVTIDELSIVEKQHNVVVGGTFAGYRSTDNGDHWTGNTLSHTGLFFNNLLLWTDEYDYTTSWTRSGLATVTPNTIEGPFEFVGGTKTADKIVENSSLSTHLVKQIGFTLSNNTYYTFSVYVKPAGRTQVKLSGYLNSTTERGITFDVSTGAAVGTTPNPPYSYLITNTGNGWYRCSITILSGTDTTTHEVDVRIASSGSDNYTGNGSSGVYLWGSQLEQNTAPLVYYHGINNLLRN